MVPVITTFKSYHMVDLMLYAKTEYRESLIPIQLLQRTVRCEANNPLQTSNTKMTPFHFQCKITQRQTHLVTSHRRIHCSSFTTLTHHVSDSLTEGNCCQV